MSEPDIYANMKSCKHCGHKMPTVAQIAGKPPRDTGGGEDADKIYFGLCVNPTCFARGPEAGSKEEAVRRWNERLCDMDCATPAPVPSPWVDAATPPAPCRLCVVEWRKDGEWRGYAELYWDSAFGHGVWRDQNGEPYIKDYQKCARWQYLDTGAGE